MYVKLFSDLLQSSLWAEDSDTRIVWVTMLLLADEDGFVHSTAPGIAHMARVSLEAAMAALKIFESEDEHSRTPDNQGQRIERLPGGYSILNYMQYRSLKTKAEQREETKKRVQAHRRREKPADVTDVTNVTPGNKVKREVTKCNPIHKQKHKEKHKEKEEETPSEPEVNAKKGLRPDSDKYEMVVDAWNETAKRLGLPEIRKLSKTRKAKLRVRLRDDEWPWKEALEEISRCAFLRGDNDRGWKADFDWFIRSEDQALAIVEGKYAGSAKEKELDWRKLSKEAEESRKRSIEEDTRRGL